MKEYLKVKLDVVSRVTVKGLSTVKVLVVGLYAVTTRVSPALVPESIVITTPL